MKTLIITLFLTSLTSLACTDFTGLYNIEGVKPKVNIKVEQTGCEIIKYTYTDEYGYTIGTIDFVTDGSWQRGFKDGELASFSHQGNKLIWKLRNSQSSESSHGIDFLNNDGDIFSEIEYTDPNGSTYNMYVAFRRLN